MIQVMASKYADDIVLFANKKHEMQLMFHIIEKFGSGLEIKFNPDKTNYLAINEHLKLTHDATSIQFFI